jgi:hypothetical protein
MVVFLAPYKSTVCYIVAHFRSLQTIFYATHSRTTRVWWIVAHFRGVQRSFCAAYKAVIDRPAKNDLREHRHHVQTEASHGE